MAREKRWVVAAEAASDEARALADSLRTSPLLAQMLINRGVTTPEAGRTFLAPRLTDLHPPEALANCRKAARRLLRAIRDREKIVIYGDYDVDGITATTILHRAIALLGGSASFYIPHRVEEGYGLNAEALHHLCDDGAQLIVSVDCGVTALDEARYVQQRRAELIVTDHHEWKEEEGKAEGGRRKAELEGAPPGSSFCPHPSAFAAPLLPDCHAIVHPRLPGDDGATYPNPHLCGAGVAFKLAWALGQEAAGGTKVDDSFKWFLVEATALAALGTIADVVPLTGENRLLAHFGLSGLKQSRILGIKALIESAGLGGRKLDSYDVGFKLAPRLNACGRMGHAALAVEMLTKADEAEARRIATYLTEQNRARQAEEKRIFDEAMEQAIALGYDRDDKRGVVLGSEGWHSGVIGIVASRVVSKLCKPVVIVALGNGGVGQGSGRSIAGFHLARALHACREHLLGSGGHEMAAGLRVERDRFEAFREAFGAYAARTVTDEMLTPKLRIDCASSLRDITMALVADLARLGPFGTANPRPLICCRDVELAGPPRAVGNGGNTVQMVVKQGDVWMRCVAFGQGELAQRLKPGMRLDLAAEPSINEYNGQRQLQLDVKDIREARPQGRP